MTAMNLAEYLEQHVQTLSTTQSKVFCHILTDTFHNQSLTEPSPKGRANEYLRYHHMILVFQERQASPSPSPVKSASMKKPSMKKSQSVLVMGMSVFEYCEWDNPTQIIRSYIQYVDTTGLYQPRKDQSHITKSVVGAYISYLQHIAKAQFIHLLATAKPNYLFAGSEYISTKKELCTEKLVGWWLSVISNVVESNAVIHAYAPGEWEDGEDVHRRMFAHLPVKEGIQYKWGLPFRDGDPIDVAIPLFEDDPKWKHYQKYMDQKKTPVRSYVYAEEESEYSQNNTQESYAPPPPRVVNVREFISTLSARPEFALEPEATFIAVHFPRNEAVKSKASNNLAGLAGKMLKDLTFEDEDHVNSSSTKILSWLKFMGSKPVVFQFSEELPPSKIPRLDTESKENHANHHNK